MTPGVVANERGVASAIPDELHVHTTLRGGTRSLDHDLFEGGSWFGLELDGYVEDHAFGYEIGATAASYAGARCLDLAKNAGDQTPGRGTAVCPECLATRRTPAPYPPAERPRRRRR